MIDELVSVIMTSYNNGDFIAEAIDSVLDQTYRNLELIIIDDASIDKTDLIVNEYKDIRIKYYKNKKNIGYPAPNRNFGISKANGRYIALLDADDIWKIDKLERQIEFLNKNQKVSAVATNFIVRYVNSGEEKKKYEMNEYIIVESSMLIKSNIIANSSVLFKKDIINIIGQFDESPGIIEDYDYWLRMIGSIPGSIVMLPEPQIYYRVHDGMISKKNNIKKQRRLLSVYKNNLKYINNCELKDRIKECERSVVEEIIKEKINQGEIRVAIKEMLEKKVHKVYFYKRILKKIIGRFI